MKKSYGCSEGQDSIEGMWGSHETGKRLPAKTEMVAVPQSRVEAMEVARRGKQQ